MQAADIEFGALHHAMIGTDAVALAAAATIPGYGRSAHAAVMRTRAAALPGC